MLTDIPFDCSQTGSLLDFPSVHQKLCASQEAGGLFHAARFVVLLQGVTENIAFNALIDTVGWTLEMASDL